MRWRFSRFRGFVFIVTSLFAIRVFCCCDLYKLYIPGMYYCSDLCLFPMFCFFCYLYNVVCTKWIAAVWTTVVPRFYYGNFFVAEHSRLKNGQNIMKA